MKKTLLLALFLFSLTGCDVDFFNEKKVDTLKEQNAKLKQELELKQRQAQMELQKQKLSAEALLEQEKLKKQAELEKEKLKQKTKKELELIRQKTELEKEKNKKELIRYAIVISALVILIIAFFLYLYIKHRRENKLQAYNDNLRKYFLLKENEMKMKMAEKILDTVKEGNLTLEDQKKLIAALSSTTATKIEEYDVEMIEHKEKE